MATAKFDDGVPSNPKIIQAGPAASWLWFCSVLYCRRGLTDGLILRIVVPSLALGLKAPMDQAARLVKVGLWDVEGENFRVHGFLDWNPSKAQIEGYRASDRERKQSRHSGQRSADIPSGIGAESERLPREKVVTTRARAKSASVSVSASVSGSRSSEKSARETTTPEPVWTHGAHGTPLVGNHARCFFAPEACARGLCIRQFLGLEWRQQGASDEEIRVFVRATVAALADGPIGDEPLKFWRAAWSARHGSQAPAAAVPAGTRQRAADVTIATLRRGGG